MPIRSWSNSVAETVAPFDALLDRNGSRYRISGAGERQHRAVTGPLDDLAAVLDRRVDGDSVVLTTQCVGRRVPDAYALRGGTDHIGEHDRPRARSQRHTGVSVGLQTAID